MERDSNSVKASSPIVISTHALTWSATARAGSHRQRREISTHALTWSATIPRHSADFSAFISTHALTWSATGYVAGANRQNKNFNSRAHVERDVFPTSANNYWSHFNSRAHVERDPPANNPKAAYTHFNSRAHVERDSIARHSLTTVTAFQLTRSRGARRVSNPTITISDNFNSRAHVERDLHEYHAKCEFCISTHALTWSATTSRGKQPTNFAFQLTRSRGARLPTKTGKPQHRAFQLTRSRGARRLT